MSKIISEMLNKPHHEMTRIINKLENKNGYPGNDVRFLADNIQKVRAKISDLGLDPDDTTGEELYHALLVKFEKDSTAFEKVFGSSFDDFDAKSKRAANLINKRMAAVQVWVVKPKIAKEIVRSQPPKKLMKIWRYRSVNSMLKREPVSEILLAAQFTESSAWQKKYTKQISKIDHSCFEARAAQVLPLTEKKWLGIQTSGELVVRNDDVGAIGLLPTVVTKNITLLCLVCLILEAQSSYEIKPSAEISKIDQLLAWWKDADHLIANLNGHHVSMHIADLATNYMHSKSFEDRSLTSGRSLFWQELINQYENQLKHEEDMLESVIARTKQKIRHEQPVFEFAEEV